MSYLKTLKFIFNIAAGIAGIFAAVLWLKSATVKVPAVDNGNFQITEDDGTDVLKTAKEQTRWSKYAAICASIAAFLQAAVMVIPD